MIQDAQCGVCAAPENGADLARKIVTLLDDPALFREYGKRSREYYRNYFSKDAFMSKLVSVLEDNCVKE